MTGISRRHSPARAGTPQHFLYRPLLLGTLLLCATVSPAPGAEWRTAGRSSWGRGTAQGMEVTEAAQLRLVSFAGTNVADGARGRVDGRNISTRLTDGNRATIWNFLDDPEVLGRVVTLDLSGNRLIDRVRVLPAEGDANPEFFIKGYRIEAAPAETPDAWQVVARRRINDRRLIDTTLDSSWTLMQEGVPKPLMARFVRLTITRQDLPNRVEIGDIEVLGTGFQASGQYASVVRDFRRPVNVGRVSWEAEEPQDTRLRLQLRTSADNINWPDWQDVPADGVTASVTEAAVAPVRYAQWRVVAQTFNPLVSPHVTSVSVTYERQVVARSGRGRVRPRQAPIGVLSQHTYVADLQIGASDRGVDLIGLDRWGEVVEIRSDGVPLLPSEYDIVTHRKPAAQVPPLMVRLASSARLDRPTRLELDFTTAFFTGSAPVALVLGSAAGDSTVLQRVAPVHQDSVIVQVSGVLEGLIPPGSVRAVPPIVRPGAAGGAHLLFELGRVQAAVPVSVTVFDLTGRRVRVLLQDALLRAGPIAIPFDGRDDDGQPLLPGVYVWKIEARAQRQQTIIRTLGVAY